MMKLLCLLKGHERSTSLVHMGDDHRRHSQCRRCAAPLVKTWDRGWVREKAGSTLTTA